MKIQPVAAELLHEDRQIDRQTDRRTDRQADRRQTDRRTERQTDRRTERQTDFTKLVVSFRNFSKAPEQLQLHGNDDMTL